MNENWNTLAKRIEEISINEQGSRRKHIMNDVAFTSLNNEGGREVIDVTCKKSKWCLHLAIIFSVSYHQKRIFVSLALYIW